MTGTYHDLRSTGIDEKSTWASATWPADPGSADSIGTPKRGEIQGFDQLKRQEKRSNLAGQIMPTMGRRCCT
jgi:hypothetical protein